MEEAMKYYSEFQYHKVYKLMSDLHLKALNSNPESHNEILFYQKYRPRINEAWNHLKNFCKYTVPTTSLIPGTTGYTFETGSNVMAMHDVATIYSELISEMSNEMNKLTTVAKFY